MAIALRSFFELLPYRINQFRAGRALRGWQIRRRRRETRKPLRSDFAMPRRLFVDIAVISGHDAGTGIQRVVRAIALGLIQQASGKWEIHFVGADRRRAYHRISWPVAKNTVDFEEMEGRPGDVFLGLDFSLDTVRRYRSQLARFRGDGGELWFLICDLLPIRRPDWFSPNNVVRYKAWLEILAGIADGFLCISSYTEGELKAVLEEVYGLADNYRTAIVPMGHEISESRVRIHDEDSGQVPMRVDISTPYVLMVGTLEPRKGHSDILDGFDTLWRAGSDRRLVIVGRLGWRVEALRDRIFGHSEFGKKLIWLSDVEDPELERIYQSCEGVILGSLGEGFGLPLIEALGHGKPVLARDLPVFHAHRRHGARYFPADADPKKIGQCIDEWITDARAGRISITVPSSSWEQSVHELKRAIEGP